MIKRSIHPDIAADIDHPDIDFHFFTIRFVDGA
jgi:hypothetical protein